MRRATLCCHILLVQRMVSISAEYYKAAESLLLDFHCFGFWQKNTDAARVYGLKGMSIKPLASLTEPSRSLRVRDLIRSTNHTLSPRTL